MQENEYKEIAYKEKVLFNEKVKVNPRSKNPETANCYVTGGSIIIESTEPLKIPLDRVEDCSYTTETEYTGTGTGRDLGVRVGPQTVRLRYRDASGRRHVAELELSTGLGASLADTVNTARRRLLHGRRAGEVFYAGFWRRFFAYLVDGVILNIIGWIIYFVPLYWTDWLALVISIIYVIGFWTWRGQTPGKMFLGVKIVKTDGSPIGIGRAILRYVGYFVSAIIIFIGYLMIAWDSKKQGLHDKIAGTCVVEVE